MISAKDALARLQSGNHRYVSEMQRATLDLESRRREVVEAQEPFAIVLGCSDSRVPIETIFDQGIGDLFVIRVAGNIAAPSQVGSIEYAAQQLGTRLVVVLGHSGCGAVAATLAAVEGSPSLNSIIERIRPAVRSLPDADPETRLRQAVRSNVRAAVDQLRSDPALADDDLLVVGAEYSLETGIVDFFAID